MPLNLLCQLACLAVTLPPVSTPPGEPLAFHGIDISLMDRKVKPTEDFYRYANGAWLDSAKIPSDQPFISANTAACSRNAGLVRQLVEYVATDSSAAQGSPEQLVGEFYRVGLDREKAERVGIKPLQAELDRIGAIGTRKELVGELGRLHRWYVDVAFAPRVVCDSTDSSRKLIDIWEGGLSLKSAEAYTSKDAQSIALRSLLSNCVRSMMSQLGDSPESAGESAHQVLDLETKLAAAWCRSDEIADAESAVHHMKIAELSRSTPSVDWSRYFTELGQPAPGAFNVAQPEYLASFGKLLQALPIEDWKAYLRWRLMATMSPYLSDSFNQVGQRLTCGITGQDASESRDQRVLWETDAALGPEIGRLLQSAGVGVKVHDKALAIVQSIRDSLRESLQTVDWMTPTTRAKAIEKLDRIRVAVGYPSHWRDSSKLVVDDGSYLQNELRAREFEFQRKLDQLSVPTDREEWKVSVYAAAAYFDSSLNMIVLPAGLLQAPYFDPQADEASNYGAFGTVVGHEFMHGFDDQGRKYDADGNLNGWWCKSDEDRFQAYQKGITDQYGAYQVGDYGKVDGRLTLAENMADLGGIRVSYMAYKHATASHAAATSGGLTADQRFFVAFSQVFRCKARPEVERLSLETNMHAPPRFRVIGVLQNIPEFWTAFGAEPPSQILRIW